MFQFFKDTKINFLRLKYVALALSSICIVAGVGYLWIHGPNLGIDFAGGHLIQLKYAQAPSLDDVRARLTAIGYGTAILQEDKVNRELMIRVQRSGDDAEDEKRAAEVIDNVTKAMRAEEGLKSAELGMLDLNIDGKAQIVDLLLKHDPMQLLQTEPTAMTPEEYARSEYAGVAAQLIDEYRAKTADGVIADVNVAIDSVKVTHHEEELKQVLRENTFAGRFARIHTEMVSAVVGGELAESALQAIIYSLLGIFAYIWFRFNNRFSVAAVIATVHDIVLTFSIYTLLGKELNLPIVAALLTIVGYSLNDTIVIFVRIREILSIKRKEAKEDYEGVLNIAINNTLSRTILTAGTTMIAVLFLYFMGGSVINDFAFTMILGIVIGTYSSIFIASPVLVIWQKITGTSGGKITAKSAAAANARA